MLSHILRWTPNPDSQPPCTDFVLLHFLRAFDVSQRGHGWMTWFPYEGHTATLSIWPTSRSKRSDLPIAGHLNDINMNVRARCRPVPSVNTNDKHTLGYYLGMNWGDQRESGPARGSSRQAGPKISLVVNLVSKECCTMFKPRFTRTKCET